MPWADRTVLVTGAAGFLGGWLVRALSQRSARVVAVVNHSTPPTLNRSAGCEIVRADICDPIALEPLFERSGIDTVFHLAAQTLPTLARENPRLTFEANARGTWNLLEAARSTSPVPRVVICSTDSVYGENDGAPFAEDARLAPSFPYETSKACAEMVALCYYETYGLPIAIARFCNLYGPGDVAESRLMAGTIAAALAGERQQLRGDGSAVRNYLYVEDAVTALLTVAEAIDRPGMAGQAFNFCDEQPVSVLDIVTRVLRFTGRPDLAPRLGAGTPGEISIKRASAAKARQVLGWAPAVNLDEGLARTVAWHRSRSQVVLESGS